MRRGVALVATAVILGACERAPEHALVPAPVRAEPGSGAFLLDRTTGISLSDAADAAAARVVEQWAGPLRAAGGLERVDGGDIVVRVDPNVASAEGYRLDVSSDGVEVIGADHAGLWYGLQTLAQLMPPNVERAGIAEAGFEIPAMVIEDAPRFAYRGMHLDVARHFFGPDFVKHYIDLLARYKINRFHWHLTEDQGWRIQIDAYPKLTEISAFRAQTQIGHGRDEFNGDGQPHGGFYTKDEVRDIVQYAADRFITIVPEIEMPGHSQAALAAYPELACTEGPFEVAQTWGVFEDIYCPYEETFTFLETVLAEVMELFPGEYIHIGGDEAPKSRWEESEYVQRLMQREGFVEEAQVQSWFIRRIERFLSDNGRRLIGWDEILEGGLAPNATVMSWRGTIGGIEAARMGHDVVMTPYSHLYFDYYQSQDTAAEPFAIGGFLPLDTVYSYDPVPHQLREGDAAHIIGVQANVWTEYMKTPEHVEYMLLPRMFALSEVAWSPLETKDFEGFTARLDWHLARLDALGINYRPLDP